MSSFRQWVRRAEGYPGTRHLKLSRQVPVKPRRPPSLPLTCVFFPDYSSFSVFRKTLTAFFCDYFKKLSCYIFFILVALVALPHPVSGQITSSYTIQVETFKERQRAVKKTESLKKKGLDAYWKETRPSGKASRYVVYIGNYESQDEAQKEAKRLKKEGVLADYSIKTLKPPGQKRSPQEQKEPAPQKTDSDLVISEITFKLKSPGKETVWIQGNQFFAPTAFAIEENKPRFVIDIKDTGPVKRELARIATDGRFIERVRTFYHKENRTLRVVLDLQPDKKYRIGQFFYQAENIYAVEVEGE